MKKFITPVSMRVTQEQFDRDLRNPLEELGYKSDLPWNEFRILGSQYPFVSCQYVGVKPCYGFYNHDCSSSCHFIDHYNPELFLALAAMTEGEEPIKNEWLVCLSDNYGEFTKGKLYQSNGYRKGFSVKIKLDDRGSTTNGWCIEYFRKATKQELIDRFSKQEFVLPEKWYIKPSNREEAKIVARYFDDNRCGMDHYVYHNNIDRVIESGLSNDGFRLGKKDGHTEITFDQFLKYILNQDETMKYKVTRKQMNEIFNIACSSWKERIVKITNDNFNAFSDESELDYNLVKEMFDAANSDQKKVLESIFGKFEDDKNAFVKRFTENNLYEISEEMFGNSEVLQIGLGWVPDHLRELKGRSLLVDSDYEVVTHTGDHDSTIIEIRKK